MKKKAAIPATTKSATRKGAKKPVTAKAKEGPIKKYSLVITGPPASGNWDVEHVAAGVGKICVHGTANFSNGPATEIFVQVNIGKIVGSFPSTPQPGAVEATCIGSTDGKFVFGNPGCADPAFLASYSTTGSWNHVIVWYRRTNPTFAVSGRNFKGVLGTQVHCAGSGAEACPNCP